MRPRTPAPAPPYPPPRARGNRRWPPLGSPPPCGEGSGVGVDDLGTSVPKLADPPPRPSPTRGEGDEQTVPHGDSPALAVGGGAPAGGISSGASIYSAIIGCA